MVDPAGGHVWGACGARLSETAHSVPAAPDMAPSVGVKGRRTMQPSQANLMSSWRGRMQLAEQELAAEASENPLASDPWFAPTSRLHGGGLISMAMNILRASKFWTPYKSRWQRGEQASSAG